ncbi:MAG: flagellar type III secretion system protein FlhB [Pseudomonadota bacterium]
MADRPDRDQKTEAASAKKLSDAAKEGNILQSKELATAIVMLAGATWFALAGPGFFDASLNLIKSGLTLRPQDYQDFDPAAVTLRLAQGVLLPLASLFGVTLLAAFATPALLGSLGFRGKALAFKGNRINPMSGLKRIFGMQGLIELGKSLAKAAVLGALGYWLVSGDLPKILGLGAQDVAPAIYSVGSSVTHALLWLSGGLLAIAAIDVPIQRQRRNADLRMTKQEVKEEMRQSEGAPEMKQARRQRAQEMLAGSARKAVEEATVILTNPTHFAVALRYRPGIDAAPVVAARGRGEVALAIRTLAKEKGVPMLEYPQLTRAIYFTTRAGHGIAEDLYIAVATILAFVFNIERAMAEGVAPPNIEVPEAQHYDEHGKRS